MTIRAEDLDLSGVKPPKPEGEQSEERLAASLAGVRRAYADLDVCLAAFLAVRCSDGWDAEAEKVRAFGAAPSEEERSLAT